MPDEPITPDAPTADAPTTDAPVADAPAPTDAPSPAPAPPADPYDDPANATFDRAYVEKLRAEAAERRVGLKPYADAFEGYDDDDRDTLLDLARALRNDPEAAAGWMRAQADMIGSRPGPDAAAEPDDDDPDAPLTAASLEKYLSERETKAGQAKAEADQVAAIVGEAKALGFDPDTDRRGYLALLDVANTETAGDLTKAAAVIAAERQKIIDATFAARTAEADGAARTPPQSGGASEKPKAPETWGDVRAAARAQLNAMHAG